MPISTRAKRAHNILNFQHELSLEQIQNTIDPIQKTFKTDFKYLPFWRFIIFQRYVGGFHPPGMFGELINYGALHSSYPSCPVNTITPIPSDLKQSSIAIILKSTHRQLLKITLYYTTGTILVQGAACREWVDEEFKMLQAVVHTMASDLRDPLELTHGDQKIPCHETALKIMSTAATTSADDLTPLSSNYSSSIELSPSKFIQALSLDSSLSHSPSTTSPSSYMLTSSQSLHSHSFHAKQSAFLSPITEEEEEEWVSPPQVSMSDSQPNCSSSAALSDVQAISTADAVTSADIVDPRLSNLETTLTQLMQDLTSYKQDFALCKTRISNDARARFQELTNELQCLHEENATLKLNLLKLERRCHGLEEAQRELKKSHKQSLPHCSSVGTQSDMPASKVSTSKSMHVDGLQNERFSSSLPPAVPIPSSKSTSSLQHSASSHQKECGASHYNDVHDSTRDRPTSSSNDNVSHQSMRLPSSCHRVVLGDSNMKNLAKRRLDSTGNTEIRTFRGATISHLEQILVNSMINSNVEEVVLSVGTNDCSSRHTSCDQVLDDYNSLISTALSTFPRAVIFVSAIMPQSSPRNNITIWDINEELELLCNERDQGRSEVFFLSLNSIWRDVSEDGKIIKDILTDRVHLSTRGIALFAKAIKECLSIPVPPSSTRSVNDGANKVSAAALKNSPQHKDHDHQKFQGYQSNDQLYVHQKQQPRNQQSQASSHSHQLSPSAHSTLPRLHQSTPSVPSISSPQLQPIPSSPSSSSQQQPASCSQQSHSSIPQQNHANPFASSYPFYPWSHSPFNSHQLSNFVQFPPIWNQLMRHPAYGYQAGLSQPFSPALV